MGAFGVGPVAAIKWIVLLLCIIGVWFALTMSAEGQPRTIGIPFSKYEDTTGTGTVRCVYVMGYTTSPAIFVISGKC